MSQKEKMRPKPLVIAAAALAAWGCASKTVPVEGRVTLDGKPLVNASVTFAPEDAGHRVAYGVTAADGSFRLSTFKPDDGAPPGGYKVVITCFDYANNPPALDHTKITPAQATGEFIKAAAKAKAAAPKPSLVPDVYGNLQTTPLRWQVSGPTQKADFQLTSGPAGRPG